MRHMIEYVKVHAGIQEEDAAMGFLEQTLRTFAEVLTRREAERLSCELPAPASRWVTEVEHGNMCSPEELCRRVQRRVRMQMGVAVEWVPVALAAMTRELSPETQEWLERNLGDDWSALLSVQGNSLVPSRPRVIHGDRHPRTLAEGRPGSATPLSESRPRLQPDSVAEDNPYGDRKLSSASDLQSEPLSSSDPRSKHPLSEEPEPK